MKLVVHVGPDTLAFDKYKSKRSLEKALERAIFRGKRTRPDSIECTFAGRKYSRIELQCACSEIMTLSEHFRHLRDWYKP